MKKVCFVALMVVLLSSLVFIGCSTSPAATPPTTTAAPQKLPVGVASPLTGPTAFLGTETTNAIMMAIDYQNSQGGVTIAGQKYMLNPILRDTKMDIVVGKSVAEELVFTEKCKVIAGPFLVDAVGAQAVTEPNKVLGFFIQFLRADMTGPGKPYSYAVSFPTPQMTYKTLYYVTKNYPNAKNVWSLEGATPGTATFAQATADSCKLLGLNYGGYEQIPLDAKDFTPIIARVMTHNPDVIDTGNVGGVFGGLGAMMLKQIRQAGFNGPIIIPAAPPEEALQETVPADALKDVITQYINIDGPVVGPKYRAVMQEYRTKYKQEPVDVVSGFYNVMTALFQFLGSQNSLDSTAWMQGFSAYKWDGVMGFQSQWIGLAGDGINRRVFQNNWVTHYVNGKPVTDFTAPFGDSLFFIPK